MDAKGTYEKDCWLFLFCKVLNNHLVSIPQKKSLESDDSQDSLCLNATNKVFSSSWPAIGVEFFSFEHCLLVEFMFEKKLLLRYVVGRGRI